MDWVVLKVDKSKVSFIYIDRWYGKENQFSLSFVVDWIKISNEFKTEQERQAFIDEFLF